MWCASRSAAHPSIHPSVCTTTHMHDARRHRHAPCARRGSSAVDAASDRTVLLSRDAVAEAGVRALVADLNVRCVRMYVCTCVNVCVHCVCTRPTRRVDTLVGASIDFCPPGHGKETTNESMNESMHETCTPPRMYANGSVRRRTGLWRIHAALHYYRALVCARSLCALCASCTCVLCVCVCVCVCMCVRLCVGM